MRALLIVLDPLGAGQTGGGFTASGNATLAHLFREAPALQLPHLFSMGLGEILHGRVFDPPARICAAGYGRMIQRSAGADALSALWELAGVPKTCPFADTKRLAPEELAALAGDGFLFHPGSLGELPREIAEAHLKTGKPVVTPGEGSALNLSAHAAAVPLSRLAHFCRNLRRRADGHHIARVTGRLVTGNVGAWRPQGEPVSYPAVPPRTILNAISERGLAVEAVGGVHEAFAHSGITRAHGTKTPEESLGLLEHLWSAPQNGLIFAHLPSPRAAGWEGLARMLEAFDAWLGCFRERMENDSLLMVAGADAGVWTDSPRQEMPILTSYGGRNGPLGVRESLADVASTLAAFFGISEPGSPWQKCEPLLTFHRPRGFDGPWAA